MTCCSTILICTQPKIRRVISTPDVGSSAPVHVISSGGTPAFRHGSSSIQARRLLPRNFSFTADRVKRAPERSKVCSTVSKSSLRQCWRFTGTLSHAGSASYQKVVDLPPRRGLANQKSPALQRQIVGGGKSQISWSILASIALPYAMPAAPVC